MTFLTKWKYLQTLDVLIRTLILAQNFDLGTNFVSELRITIDFHASYQKEGKILENAPRMEKNSPARSYKFSQK